MPPGYISNTVGDEFWPSFGRALATPLSCLSIAMWAHRSWLHNLLEKKMGKGRRKAAGNPRHLTCNDRPHSPWQATNGQNLSSNLNGILLSSPKTSTSLLLRRFSLFCSIFFFLASHAAWEWAWSQGFWSCEGVDYGFSSIFCHA